MRLVLSNSVYAALGIALAASSTHAFSISNQFSRRTFVSSIPTSAFTTTTTLNAKPKGKNKPNVDFDAFDDDEPMSKKDQIKAAEATAKAAKKATDAAKQSAAAPPKDAKAAALAALDLDMLDLDAPMSAKEKAQMEKKKAKEAKKAVAAGGDEAPAPGMNKKALKALEEMERMEKQMEADAASGGADANVDEFGMPKAKLSKKEQKDAAKKAEKDAAKQAAKDAKKAAKRGGAEEEGDADVIAESVPDLVGATAAVGAEEGDVSMYSI